MGFNKVILQGNLVEDITLRYTNNGKAVASSKIAVGEKFKKADGSKGEKTLFIGFTLWGGQAEVANSYLRKGSKVLFEGKIENKNYEKQDGTKVYDYNILVESMQMLDSKPQDSQQNNVQYQNAPQDNRSNYQPQQQPPEYNPNQGQQQMQYNAPNDVPDDDSSVPF